MAIVRKSITWTDQLNKWVQTVLAQGDYTNESEYIRDLIRHDRERRSQQMDLQVTIKEGLDSGISQRGLPDIMDAVEEKMRANGKL